MTPLFKFLVALAVTCLLGWAVVDANAATISKDGLTITLTKAEKAKCEAEGGCIYISLKDATDVVLKVVEKELADEQACLKSST